MVAVHLLDGLPLEDDPRHIISSDRSGTCSLVLDSLTAQDSGQYACYASSFMGSAGTLAKVVVQGEYMAASEPLECVSCCTAMKACTQAKSQRDLEQQSYSLLVLIYWYNDYDTLSITSFILLFSSTQICVPTGERLSDRRRRHTVYLLHAYHSFTTNQVSQT